jgi:benzylsuccinate CoA-transferase BbsF subunit
MPLPAIDRSLPLAGLRVLDFATTLAGPSAARHLADFGAQVIKIESGTHPDTLRVATPYADGVAGINRSGYFAVYNAGKLSLQLNMQLAAARDAVRRLVEVSDVLLEAYVPGVMARWGLAYPQIAAWNPAIVMASHCLQGQTGPHAVHRGYGQIASGMSGWYDLTGEADGEPLGPYSAYTDFVCWPYLASAILVALEVREQTGRGQYIDHAQLETSIHYLAAPLLDLQLSGEMATRNGNHEAYACPNNAYRCAGDDRWLAITVTADSEWAALCAVLGQSTFATDPRFATLTARKAHEAELDALISDWLAAEEPFALAARLQAAGVAAGVAQRAQDLFADPQLQHRQFFRRLPHAEIGEHAVLTQTFRIDALQPGPWSAAPLLGEHTEAICAELLGLSDEQLAGCAVAGLFE